MTQELQKTDWKDFFDRINITFLDWETTVHIMNSDVGDQILSKGLPFNGLIFEDRNGNEVIELSVGSSPDNHQTHNIIEPTKIAFEENGSGPAGTLDIEESSGTKTLVTFVQPMPVLVEYLSAKMIAMG